VFSNFIVAGRRFGNRMPGKRSTRHTQCALDDPKPNDEYEKNFQTFDANGDWIWTS
jgi:hypothetical protein